MKIRAFAATLDTDLCPKPRKRLKRQQLLAKFASRFSGAQPVSRSRYFVAIRWGGADCGLESLGIQT
jgi:hypothetical protein